MNDYAMELKWNKLLYASILIVVGLILFLFPTQISAIVSIVIGVAFILMGVAVIITYLAKNAVTVLGGNRLVIGVAFVALGIYVLCKSDFIVSIVPFILGLIVLVSGVNKLQNFIDMKRLDCEGGIVTLVFAIINIAFGVVLIINPFDAAMLLLKITGIALIFSGITDLAATFILQNFVKKSGIKNPRGINDTNADDVVDASYRDADK